MRAHSATPDAGSLAEPPASSQVQAHSSSVGGSESRPRSSVPRGSRRFKSGACNCLQLLAPSTSSFEWAEHFGRGRSSPQRRGDHRPSPPLPVWPPGAEPFLCAPPNLAQRFPRGPRSDFVSGFRVQAAQFETLATHFCSRTTRIGLGKSGPSTDKGATGGADLADANGARDATRRRLEGGLSRFERAQARGHHSVCCSNPAPPRSQFKRTTGCGTLPVKRGCRCRWRVGRGSDAWSRSRRS